MRSPEFLVAGRYEASRAYLHPNPKAQIYALVMHDIGRVASHAHLYWSAMGRVACISLYRM